MIGYSLSQAQQHVQAAIVPINESERITSNDALNRIVANDIIAPINVPSFDNSAMDGYAFCSEDLSSNNQLTIVGNAYAGHPYSTPMLAGQAVHITTGAKLPEYCDTVLPVELATVIDETTLDMRNINPRAGQHRRRCGEDLAKGDIAITKGTRLGSIDLGLLASLGITEFNVQRRLRVALFSTGDELRIAGQALDDACIYDSNRVILRAMLQRFGVEVVDLGILADNPVELESVLTNIAPTVDTIITSGGVAGGAKDYTKQVMCNLGDVTFMDINMRPGRPFAFGKMDHSNGHTYLFGLPGNPVAVMVSFYFLVRPALQLLSGEKIFAPIQIHAIATERISKKMGRTEFQRGVCQVDAQGRLNVKTTGEQGSGILSSISKANCLIALKSEQGNIEIGDAVQIILFEGLL